jgi:hypothetical protein
MKAPTLSVLCTLLSATAFQPAAAQCVPIVVATVTRSDGRAATVTPDMVARMPAPPPSSKCPAADYTGDASKDLLSGLKLSKAQNDSAGKIDSQSKAAMALATPMSATQTTPIVVSSPVEAARIARTMRPPEFTPEMHKVLADHIAALRAILTPEQHAAFDANLEKRRAAGKPVG